LLQSWLLQWPILFSDIPTAEPVSLILYSTSACHLCEQAECLLLKVLAPNHRYSLIKKDIALDDVLLERYGTSIPVLAKVTKNGANSELFWPFDENKIITFLTR